MDTTYRLTQTGKQVQDLLDQVDPNKEAIAAETTRAEAAEQTLQDNIDAEHAAREEADAALRSDLTAEAERAEIAEHTLQGNIDAEEQSRIADVDAEQARAEAAEQANATAIAAETTRATTSEDTLQDNIDAEEQARIADVDAEQARAEAAEQANATAIADEETRATAAEQTLQDNIDAEEARAEAAEQQNASDISAINAKIPAEASAQNQLADKSFVNSSVATASATFRGSYNLILDLHLPIDATRQQIVGALNASIHEADNNDYCFVQIPTDPEHALLIQAVDRYKFNGSTWAFEYALNNSGFTQAQWAALNSGITSGLVAKLNGLPNNDALTQLLAGKQDNLMFDSTPTDGSQNPVTSAGIKEAIDAISGGSSAALDAEIARATAAEQAIQDDLDDESQTRQAEDIVLQQNIEAEETRARAAEQQNATDIAAINAKIPVEASAQNQLADKNYVNTCVATDSATFRGSYNLVTDLHLTVAATRAQILAALAATIAVADNNDYAFVLIPTSDATPNTIARVERYKYNGTQWGFEYELNNSGFTQAQWDAINSGITSGLVAKLNDLPNEAALQALLQGLQDAIDDEETRATAAEQANATAIASETTRATTVEGTLQDNIDAEEQARIAADNALDAKIGDNTDAIASETTRATAAEQANATAIASETTRATTAEGTLQDNIDEEEQARIAADNALDAKIGDNTDAIAAETTRATAAEQANATAIAAETTRATAAEQTLQDNIDAEETARIAADNALDAKIGDNTDAIAAETTRATAAEQANATAIASETTRATTAEGTLQDNIDAEEQARIAADNALDAKIGDNTDAIAAETTRATAAEQTLQDNIDAEETARIAADNALDAKIGDNTDAIAAETTRATAAEQANATAIASETTRATTAEGTLQDNIDAEEQARIAADEDLQDAIDTKQDALIFDSTPTSGSNNPVTSDGIRAAIDTAVGNEETRARAAEQVNALAIDDVEALIPNQATSQNQLADKAYVQNAIATNTGDFVGTFNSLAELEAVPDPHNNDYGYVISVDQQGNQSYDRYKYNGSTSAWEFEYSLNNSSFTAEEWAAIQSGITSALVTKLSDLYTKAQLDVILDSKQSALTFDNVPTQGSDNPVKSGGIYNSLADKQDVISDLASIRSGAAAGATAYQKPSSGIPKTDLSQGVQDSLDAADSAYQKPSTGIPETDLDATLQQKINSTVDITGKADKVDNATSGDLAALDANGNLTDSGKKVSDFATAAQGALADTAYQKPTTGIPSTDLASGVQDSLSAADTAYQLPSNGIPKTDLASGVQDSLDAADSAYQKPSSGIPDTDLSQGVQDSLDAADSAYQKPSTGIPETDLDSTTQSKIDAGATAYQKPSGGIPDTDLSSAVQTSLGKADAAAPQSTTYTKAEVDNLVGAEETRAEGVEQGLQGDIDAIEAKIPSAATAQNQLADKAFVNSSVATNTANYISNNGEPFTSLAQLEAYSGTLTNNDYAFVVGIDQAGNTTYTRYKYNATTQTWAAEYVLNNSSFTADQWDAISSGITAALVGKLSDLPTNSELTTLLAGKQDVISDLATIRSGAAAGATAYQKPSGGIPSTDLAQGVQTSLGKADTAYQKPSGGIPSTDLAQAVQTSLGKADTAYQKPSGGIPYADIAANAKGLPVGSGTVTSLASLPVTNRVIIATISANQPSVSIANGVTGLPAGCDLHVIIHATADVTIIFPTSSPYVNCNADSALTVASGGYAELNFVSDGTSIYVRGIV